MPHAHFSHPPLTVVKGKIHFSRHGRAHSEWSDPLTERLSSTRGSTPGLREKRPASGLAYWPPCTTTHHTSTPPARGKSLPQVTELPKDQTDNVLHGMGLICRDSQDSPWRPRTGQNIGQTTLVGVVKSALSPPYTCASGVECQPGSQGTYLGLLVRGRTRPTHVPPSECDCDLLPGWNLSGPLLMCIRIAILRISSQQTHSQDGTNREPQSRASS